MTNESKKKHKKIKHTLNSFTQLSVISDLFELLQRLGLNNRQWYLSLCQSTAESHFTLNQTGPRPFEPAWAPWKPGRSKPVGLLAKRHTPSENFFVFFLLQPYLESRSFSVAEYSLCLPQLKILLRILLQPSLCSFNLRSRILPLLQRDSFSTTRQSCLHPGATTTLNPPFPQKKRHESRFANFNSLFCTTSAIDRQS